MERGDSQIKKTLETPVCRQIKVDFFRYKLSEC